jgi:acyl-CoA thioesterase II
MPETNWADSLRDLRRDGDRFVAEPQSGRQFRLFGGLVLAYALHAAAETVPDPLLPQSLHAYFVRAGAPGKPIDLDVVQVRDGRAFSTRRVTASQEGKVILEMMGSFHVPETGEDWHPPAPRRPGPDEALPVQPLAGVEWFEIRAAGETTTFAGPPYWLRVRQPVSDDPVTQACVLTYISDMGLMAAARPAAFTMDVNAAAAEAAAKSPEERRPLERNAASLDHAIWFHRPFDPHAWHRYEATKLNGNDARGLAQGAFYDTDGTLVASTAQEALWRV